MAGIVDGSTLVGQGLHYSNLLLAEGPTTPTLMLNNMITDDFINDDSKNRWSNPFRSRDSLLQCLNS